MDKQNQHLMLKRKLSKEEVEERAEIKAYKKRLKELEEEKYQPLDEGDE